MTESVIDFPKEGLCPEVWNKVLDTTGSDYVWALVPSVKEKADTIISYVVDALSQDQRVMFSFSTAHVTGSITSNSYAENADIDLHLVGEVSNQDIANEIARAAFSRFKSQDSEKAKVEDHPFEVYIQSNPYQDMMSVGCYDLRQQKWVVGPELKSQDYNPYSDLYADVKKASEKKSSEIRNIILGCYEQAIVCKKILNGNDSDTFLRETQILDEKLQSAAKLFDELRNLRKVYSSPTSKEQALEFRSSRKWHVADAAFKLLDKYGYLAILKKFKALRYFFGTGSTLGAIEEALTQIILVVKDMIGNKEKLRDSEALNEGPVQNVLLAAMLAVPGILPAAQVKKTIDSQPSYSYIVNDLNKQSRMVGDYTAFQAANIIARTLFAEARNDGKVGMTAVASVVFNRAEGKAKDFANVCKKHSYSKKAGKDIYQFSCWNKMTDSDWSPKTFKVKLPKSVKTGTKEQKLWEQAMEIAASMLSGSFKPITTANMYYNDKICSPEWGSQLSNSKHIGSHKFGTLKNHSAFV